MPTHKSRLHPEDELVGDKVASEILGISNPRTMSNWRANNKHPDLAFLRIGRSIRYRVGDLLDFRRRHTVGGVNVVEPVVEHAAQAASTQAQAPALLPTNVTAANKSPISHTDAQQTCWAMSQASVTGHLVRPSDLVRKPTHI